MTAITPAPRNPQMVSRAKTLEEKKEKERAMHREKSDCNEHGKRLPLFV